MAMAKQTIRPLLGRRALVSVRVAQQRHPRGERRCVMIICAFSLENVTYTLVYPVFQNIFTFFLFSIIIQGHNLSRFKTCVGSGLLSRSLSSRCWSLTVTLIMLAARICLKCRPGASRGEIDMPTSHSAQVVALGWLAAVEVAGAGRPSVPTQG